MAKDPDGTPKLVEGSESGINAIVKGLDGASQPQPYKTVAAGDAAARSHVAVNLLG